MTHNCSSLRNEKCANTQGGFDCVCKDGFNRYEYLGSCDSRFIITIIMDFGPGVIILISSILYNS